jgi:cation diffusion facilitator family transporter
MEPTGPNAMKTRAATVSLLYNLSQTVLKLAAAMLTGSVALLTEAAHSATDVVASLIALVSVRAAMAPPDEEHPYGHGKIESLAGFAEAILLLLIVGYVLFEAFGRLLLGGVVQRLDIGIAVMIVNIVGSLIVGRYVSSVAKKTGSLALRSNGQHLFVDFYTSVGVLVALTITWATGWQQADSIAAILLSVWLARGAWRLSKQAFHQLIDRRLEDGELETIVRLVREEPELLSFHRLRTRLSGNVRYVDLHIVVPTDWSLVQAHRLADRLEKTIEAALAPAHVVIHVDPYDARKARAGSSGAAP